MEKSKNKSNFCIKPFNSTLIKTNGELRVCCEIDSRLSKFADYKDSDGKIKYNIKKDKIEQWWDSKYIKYVRKSILENKKLDECAICWKKEEHGLESLRTETNYQYKAIFKNKYERNLKLINKDNLSYPEDMEIQITNLCNLKCAMCTGASSSRLLIENNALGYENLNQKDYDLNDRDYEKIRDLAKHDITLLNLRGGEPLMNKRVINLLLDLISSNKAKQMSLHITTNGTMCNKEILNTLKQFKHVRLMLSIEGTGRHNEYIRYPSSWNIINENINQFKELTNTYIYINTVVQNLNVMYIDQLIEYSHKNNFHIHLSRIYEPDYLDMLNLPKQTLQQALDKLKLITDDKLVHTNNVKEIISLIKARLDNYVKDENKYTQFIDMVKKRDHYRKVNLRDYMPELAKEIGL